MVTFIQSKATSNAGARASEAGACDPQWQGPAPSMWQSAHSRAVQRGAGKEANERTNAKEKNAHNRK